MSLSTHISELKRKHAALSDLVDAEQRRPGSDDLEVRRMKQAKLRLKEEISRLDPTVA
ncbi:MAG: DUF465 domain-containing protein [Pseudomonadota bacterium]